MRLFLVTARRAAVAALIACLAVALPGCGDDARDAAATTAAPPAGAPHAGHAPTATFEGGTISPVRRAPALRLDDVDGRPVDIGAMRGAPVLVTFVYATCPDVCPLIMSSLRQVRRDGGEAGRSMRVIAVSVDPEGDTPAVVRRFLRAQRVDDFVDYVVGTRAELEPVWDAWQIAQDVPKDDPELIEHTSLIYGVNAAGELATAYPVGFAPEAVARDLALLART
jgi:protein SCO1/2